jgi:hypothetical protein
MANWVQGYAGRWGGGVRVSFDSTGLRDIGNSQGFSKIQNKISGKGTRSRKAAKKNFPQE